MIFFSPFLRICEFANLRICEITILRIIEFACFFTEKRFFFSPLAVCKYVSIYTNSITAQCIVLHIHNMYVCNYVCLLLTVLYALQIRIMSYLEKIFRR